MTLTLLLFTASYPFESGGEKNFLHEEIKYLQEKFSRIVLIPRHLKGEKDELPIGVEVDENYSNYLYQFNKFTLFVKILTSVLFYKELFLHPYLLLYPKAIFRLFIFLAGALMTKDWVKQWLIENKEQARNVLFYTYWFDHASLGISLLKKDFPSVRLVSRAHGYDLYEEHYYTPPYLPYRSFALSLIDSLFPDSYTGLQYIKNRYPIFSDRYEVALLGVPDPGFATRSSIDGIFRILSCSMLVEVKRVDLILEGIAVVASLRPTQRFEWHHIGNGKQRDELQKKVQAMFPITASAYFLEYHSKESLMKFYKQSSIDVFINASSTEGTPVAVMEAISCGVPIIATSVGGNTEIVSERNGLLLSPNPTPEEIAYAILKILDNPDRAQKMKVESRKVWQESYNAETNFQKFAEKLEEIAEG